MAFQVLQQFTLAVLVHQGHDAFFHAEACQVSVAYGDFGVDKRGSKTVNIICGQFLYPLISAKDLCKVFRLRVALADKSEVWFA